MKNTLFLLLILLNFSCAPLLNLESGRTSGVGNQSIQVNVDAIYIPESKSDLPGFFPIAELKYNYGIYSKLDVGVSVTSGLNAQFFTKYQFYGTEESKIAMAAGLKIGKQIVVTGESGPTRFYLPLYFSIHPNENFAFFVNPMYMKQVLKGDDSSDFFGITSGTIFYFNDNELSIGANYNFIKTNTEGDNLLSFGLGYKFAF